MAEGARTEVIRAKLVAGTLPLTGPSQVWAGPGTGAICSACDVTISGDDIEYEVAIDGAAFRFHRPCFEAWQHERIGLAPPTA